MRTGPHILPCGPGAAIGAVSERMCLLLQGSAASAFGGAVEEGRLLLHALGKRQLVPAGRANIRAFAGVKRVELKYRGALAKSAPRSPSSSAAAAVGWVRAALAASRHDDDDRRAADRARVASGVFASSRLISSARPRGGATADPLRRPRGETCSSEVLREQGAEAVADQRRGLTPHLGHASRTRAQHPEQPAALLAELVELRDGERVLARERAGEFGEESDDGDRLAAYVDRLGAATDRLDSIAGDEVELGEDLELAERQVAHETQPFEVLLDGAFRGGGDPVRGVGEGEADRAKVEERGNREPGQPDLEGVEVRHDRREPELDVVPRDRDLHRAGLDRFGGDGLDARQKVLVGRDRIGGDEAGRGLDAETLVGLEGVSHDSAERRGGEGDQPSRDDPDSLAP